MCRRIIAGGGGGGGGEAGTNVAAEHDLSVFRIKKESRHYVLGGNLQFLSLGQTKDGG
jgi:hypothetical protein